MEEVKTIARFIYVVHPILVCGPRWTFWYWRLFHVPKVSESIS